MLLSDAPIDGKLIIAGQYITGTQARLKLTRDFVAGNLIADGNQIVEGDLLVEGNLTVNNITSTGVFTGETSFTPANSADWSGDPSTVKEAIDRLAAALSILQGSPIA
jgi:hypothetical protein